MRIRRVRIFGFRGIRSADLWFQSATAIVGPNGCGKSTIIDAISLALGRPKMVRPLTEHDFSGSAPEPAARLRVLVTLVGFSSNDPNDHEHWFRKGRAVEKWLDDSGKEYTTDTHNAELCVTLGFAARFDHDSLDIETLRYFHDDDAIVDPFAEEGAVAIVPQRLLAEVGYFLLPARRTWDAVVSFNSELFRRTIVSSSGIPAKTILDQRDALRAPANPVESAPELCDLTASLNEQLERLLLNAPKFQLRVTAGDSEAVLQALLPHYAVDNGPSLPAYRHGTGLVSLQTLLLLLEVGKRRRSNNESFILALEEPELHLAPGVEGRLVAEALRLADQVVCTTHSPDVARLFQPIATLIASNDGGNVSARPLLPNALTPTAKAWERKFYGPSRGRVLSALMHPFVLVPEGRFDVEWLTRIASIADREQSQVPPFACVYGIAPTEDAKVAETVTHVRRLRGRVIALVDGDKAGDDYIKTLNLLAPAPDAIIQWPDDWTIEDVVKWSAEAGGPALLAALKTELNHVAFSSFDELRDRMRSDSKAGGIKPDTISHDTIAALIEQHAPARARASEVCEVLVRAALGDTAGCPRITRVNGTAMPPHYRFVP